jgi:hypothetical protein
LMFPLAQRFVERVVPVEDDAHRGRRRGPPSSSKTPVKSGRQFCGA